MKDLTHYFQLPPKENDSTSHKENIDVLTLQDDSEEIFFRKSDKISNSMYKHTSKTSPLSSSSLKIENKSNSSKMSKVKLDESKQDDCQDISIVVQNNIWTEAKSPSKKCSIETASSQTESSKNYKRKEKLCLSSNKMSKRKSSSKNVTEQKIEKATGENLISESTEKISSKDENMQEKSSNIKLDPPSEDNKTTDKDNTMKTPPQLNDNANAFYILMSSRAWKSPHAEENKNRSELSSADKKMKRSVAETPLKTAEMKENNKKRKKILEDMAEQKRIKKIKHDIPSEEIVNKNINVRSKRILIIPDSDSDDANDLLDNTVISKTGVKCNDKGKDANTDHKIDKSFILIEDITCKKDKLSKDENSSNISPMKLYNSRRKSPRTANYKLIIEDSEDSSSEQEKCFKEEVKEILHNDEEDEKNLKRNPKQKLNTNNNKKTMKSKSKFLIEDSETESEEVKVEKSLKRTPRKLGTVRNKKTVQIKRKLLHDSSESENEKSVRGRKRRRNKLSRKNNESVKVKLTDQLKSPLSFKKNANWISITTIKNTPNKTEKKKKKSVKEEENASDKIECGQKENIEKNINSKKSTDLSPAKKKERNEDTEDYGSNSKCETGNKSSINSSEQDAKKINSLFSYFNKVTKSEAISKSEVIKVKAQIHSPPASPSAKRRSSRVASNNVNRKRRSCSNKVSDKEEQIIVLESSVTEKLNNTACPETEPIKPTTKRKEQKTPPSSGWRMRVKLRKSPPEPTVDEGDDDGEDSGDIFTPKKNWPTNKPSAQQKAAREVLKKAKTIFTQRSQNDSSPPVIQAKTTPVQHKSDEDKSDEVVICSSPENKLDTAVKLAPLFVRAKPKPKLDPAVVEARKNFLKSGVPESVKKLVDLQRSMEEQCYFTFPSVAHVQQRDEKCIMWDLPLVNFSMNENITNTVYPSLAPLEEIKLGTFNICTDSQKPNCLQELSVPTPITSFRKLLRTLKMESPDFAIYRNFRRLRLKNNPNTKDVASTDNKKDIKPKRKSGRKSRHLKSSAIEDHKTEIFNTNIYTMWTEKYKPLAAEDIVGNGRSMEQLKKWLETWKRCNDEVLRKDKGGERKRKDSSSGDEFMDFNDSNDSINGNLPNNTAILVGPHGCGKTAAVYAIANELGCKVLEINASSKRNGKRMLSELQEATQSHQVRAGTDHASAGEFNFFLNGENKKPKKKKTKTNKVLGPKQNGSEDNGSSKMSLILVEGADVVYEDQDEGFISALNTLVASSKRPVILVANDPQCPHLLRFMDSKLLLKFTAPSSKTMSVWLQLMCLLEGLRVSRAEIERLLDKNLADVRQTMLQLQFWILSGGSNFPMYKKNNVPVSPEKQVIPQMSVEDEQSNLSWASNEETDDTSLSIPEFSHCVETFTEYDQQFINNQQLPFPMDLSAIWWNLTSLLSLPENLYRGRIDSQSQSTEEATLKDCDGFLDVSDDELTKKEVEDSIVKTVTNVSGKAQLGCDDDTESDTVSLSSTKETNISETVNKLCLKEKEESGIVSDGTESNGSAKEGSMSQSSEVQSTNKNACTQLEIDSVFRLLERMSTIDIISTRTDVSCVTCREPCLRSWDKVPQDGTSLSESEHCQWWENSVSRALCHRLVEGSVHTCRTQLQEARNCSQSVMESKITYCRPTQSELRWRSSQHAANNALLPGVALWNRIDHHSVCSDYFPMLRAVSRCEKERLTCNTKRRNRFFHYLKGLNIHVGDTTLGTLCATFDNKIVA